MDDANLESSAGRSLASGERWRGAEQLDLPVWICDEQQRVVFVNRATEVLLGVPRQLCRGRRCHDLIRGVDAQGQVRCRADCPHLRGALRGGAVRPYVLGLKDAHGSARSLRVIPWVERHERGRTHVVHLAQPLAPEAEPRGVIASRRDGADLTLREGQILDLLARGIRSRDIAVRLCLSYATVRNHVQNLLPKLGVHSILEAATLRSSSRSNATD